MKKTIYSFKNKMSLGINLVPQGSLIEIENYNGLDEVLLVSLKVKSDYDENTTIGAFLESNTYQVLSVQKQEITEDVQYSYANISGREIIDIECDGTDYSIVFSEERLIFAEPQGIVLGASGLIEIINEEDKEFEIDKEWILSQYYKNIFRYTVLPSGRVALTGI